MQQRKMTKIGVETSRLGMGLMRLPVTGEGKIDYEAGTQMIDRLMEAGVTYYDTAYFYHNGDSQVFAQKALTSRYDHSKYTIATKMPLGEVDKQGGPQGMFDYQQKTLGVDYIDFYLLHGIDYQGWLHAKKIGADKVIDEMKKAGRIRYNGFSFHGAAEDLPKILDEKDWDFVQIQLNYYDWELGDGKQLYEAAHSRGVPVIVMEPVRGGGLANCHPDVMKILENPDHSVASWAIRWCGSLEGVDVVLSGMSNMDQVEDNLRSFSPFAPLTDSEREIIAKACERFKSLPLVPCTECKYCNKCPQGIEIHRIFSGYNDVVRFGSSWFLSGYKRWTKPENQVSACIECGACEEICPQRISIIPKIREIIENHA